MSFSKNKAESKMENPTQIVTAGIAGHLKLLEHQKLDSMILQQSEHSICISYMFTASISPVSATKHSDLNCPLLHRHFL